MLNSRYFPLGLINDILRYFCFESYYWSFELYHSLFRTKSQKFKLIYWLNKLLQNKIFRKDYIKYQTSQRLLG